MPGIFEQAQKLHQAGKLAEAERLYQQILQGNGHDPEIWFLLGDALQGQGRPGPRSASLRQLTIVFSEGIVGSGRAFRARFWIEVPTLESQGGHPPPT